MVVGMCLVIASQCVQAAQVTFEDFFMVRNDPRLLYCCGILLIPLSLSSPRCPG